jgi:hypothetical protein
VSARPTMVLCRNPKYNYGQLVTTIPVILLSR